MNRHRHPKTLRCCYLVLLSHVTLSNPVDCSLPGSSVYVIVQARILEWVDISFSRGIFPTQGLNLPLLHWQVDSIPLSHMGSSRHWGFNIKSRGKENVCATMILVNFLSGIFKLVECSSDFRLSMKWFGEGDGTPLQYSCLENPMDGGAWWAVVHGVAKSRTRLGDFTLTFHSKNPLQCSCLENPRDGGVWWAAVYGVAHSQTQLKRLSSSSMKWL